MAAIKRWRTDWNSIHSLIGIRHFDGVLEMRFEFVPSVPQLGVGRNSTLLCSWITLVLKILRGKEHGSLEGFFMVFCFDFSVPVLFLGLICSLLFPRTHTSLSTNEYLTPSGRK